jgi:hypothetical protein
VCERGRNCVRREERSETTPEGRRSNLGGQTLNGGLVSGLAKVRGSAVVPEGALKCWRATSGAVLDESKYGAEQEKRETNKAMRL